ncbi:hypothetical protein GRX03_03135 [Halovenus sp. WSH3]|uniref:Small CPxCG-related zinc finger protein n=1 Tax=Halovenus carboxidivorans TaxID=2692199 RepID=A0A6B0SYF9_9EURY|nr:DUF6276 family protein [Halovenus carboxidivorans]MXR50604.1 hypothetical protein [Halovenus carboxidivorans]
MECQECSAGTVQFAVPTEYDAYLPGEESVVALCTRCLAIQPATTATGEPDFGRVSDAFPSSPEAAVPLALLLGLLENLALYRTEITELLDAVERAGTDPLLALDRLARDPDIDTDLDLSGRRRQLEQLL